MHLFFPTETGWPMTCHSIGLGMPDDYPFGSCGRPCPGWNGMLMYPCYSRVEEVELSYVGHIRRDVCTFRGRLFFLLANTPIGSYSHWPILPLAHTPIGQYSHWLILLLANAPICSYSYWPILPLAHTPIGSYSHWLILPLAHTPIGQYSHWPILPLAHTPIGSYSHWPILPLANTPIGQYSHWPILPLAHTPIGSFPLTVGFRISDVNSCSQSTSQLSQAAGQADGEWRNDFTSEIPKSKLTGDVLLE